MKAYTFAELAVSLTIVFALLIASIFTFQSFTPSSAFRSDKESISSKLTEAAILSRNPDVLGLTVAVRVADRQMTIFKVNDEGKSTKSDNNPIYIKSDSISISPEIVFSAGSGTLKGPTRIELTKGSSRKSLNVNELGIINE